MPRVPSAPKTALEALLELHLDVGFGQYSQSTITTRREQLRVIVKGAQRCLYLERDDPNTIFRYQCDLIHHCKRNGQPLSFRTQYGMLVPLRGWFRWMTRENCVPHNPALDLELPRIGDWLAKDGPNTKKSSKVGHNSRYPWLIVFLDHAILKLSL